MTADDVVKTPTSAPRPAPGTPVPRPSREDPSPTGTTRTDRTAGGRLVGVDLARALAVFGMYAVHVGPQAAAVGGVGGWLIGLSEGRASALFAVLAGFSVALITGRERVKEGRAGRQARARVVLRALSLLVGGTALTLLAGDVVILAYYGVYFLLTLPLLRLGFRALAVLAAALAVVTPLLQWGLQLLLTPGLQHALTAYDPLERISGVGVLDLLLTGGYPTITWMTFVVAGMALARLDLSRPAVQRAVAAAAAGLVALAYGLPRALSHLLGGPLLQAAHEPWGRAADALAPVAGQTAAGAVGGGTDGGGWLLLLARPHSGSTFDLLGCIGVAALVLVGCVVLVAASARVRWVLTPVIAVGTMSLTVYVGHFLAPILLGVPFGDESSVTPLLGYVAAATAFAWTWSRFFRRGPLEELLHRATGPAGRVR